MPMLIQNAVHHKPLEALVLAKLPKSIFLNLLPTQMGMHIESLPGNIATPYKKLISIHILCDFFKPQTPLVPESGIEKL